MMALGHEVRSEERDARRADLPIPEEAQQGGRSAFSYIDVSLVRSGAETSASPASLSRQVQLRVGVARAGVGVR